MVRLFVALPVSDAVAESLRVICNGLPGARWVPPENFHVTLRFIGEIDHGLAHDVHDSLARIDAPALELEIDGLDWFGSKWKPSSLYARVKKTDPLVHLQKKVESAVVRAGLKPESRKFCPHVTLARCKHTAVPDVERYIRERKLDGPATWEADCFTLYSSFLSSSGPIYEAEAEYPLRLMAEPADAWG
ncbi:MAG: RNA 2',3'-cyclic phosphodiesterase [Marivibrio sp.]|uniref:RNA 2',3'-cyclic phosphodiesterase n=1 Tax=Marivibrio sp. TaxID=2039719 RepID=UPI0032EC2806